MITATPGATIYPSVDWGTPGATLGVRIRRKTDGVDVVARTTVGVAESPALSGVFTQAAGLVAPLTEGAYYMVVWDDTVTFAVEDMTVTSASVAVVAPGDLVYPSVNWGVTGATLGVRIRRKTDGVDVVARTTTGISESPAGSALYVSTVGVAAPTTLGALYEIVWDDLVDYAVEDLTVSPAVPSGTDLCTVADVHDLMEKASAATTIDALIQRHITRISAIAPRRYLRDFAPMGTLTRRVLVSNRIVPLTPYDLRSATTVTMDPLGSPVILTTSDYALEPYASSLLGTYTWLQLGEYVSLYSETQTQFNRGVVEITGVWGPAAVPPDVSYAAALTVASWLSRPIAAANALESFQGGDGEVRPDKFGGFAIPFAAHRIFAQYERLVFA